MLLAAWGCCFAAAWVNNSAGAFYFDDLDYSVKDLPVRRFRRASALSDNSDVVILTEMASHIKPNQTKPNPWAHGHGPGMTQPPGGGGGVGFWFLVLVYSTVVLLWTPFYRQRPGLEPQR